MEYRSPVYIQNDCSCGYATNNTKDCKQKECSKYIYRELKCAKIELDHDMKIAHERYITRIENILKNKEV